MEQVRQQVLALAGEQGLLDEEVVVVSARPLAPHEAIGHPSRQDFPLLKGKEVLVEATFRGNQGQAYTSSPGDYCGSVRQALDRALTTDWDRTLVTATANALLRYFGRADHTVHCRDREPDLCAGELVHFLQAEYGNPRVAVIGLQPALVAALAGSLPVRVTDMDPENIGHEKAGVLIEGAEKNSEIIAWADVVMATGSVIVNDSYDQITSEKPTLYFGTTVAGAAAILGLKHYCPFSH